MPVSVKPQHNQLKLANPTFACKQQQQQPPKQQHNTRCGHAGRPLSRWDCFSRVYVNHSRNRSVRINSTDYPRKMANSTTRRHARGAMGRSRAGTSRSMGLCQWCRFRHTCMHIGARCVTRYTDSINKRFSINKSSLLGGGLTMVCPGEWRKLCTMGRLDTFSHAYTIRGQCRTARTAQAWKGNTISHTRMALYLNFIVK